MIIPPATCTITQTCFCETVKAGLIAQTSNTWSSLSFIIVGLIIGWLAMKDTKKFTLGKNLLKNNKTFGLFYGGLVIFIGLGTMYYHARLNLLGQFFDITGMYLLILSILFYRLPKIFNIQKLKLFTGYIGANFITILIQFLYPDTRRYIFAGLIILTLLVEYKIRKITSITLQNSLLFLAIGTMLLGFIIWILDITKILCNPHSLLQGHAIWHICCSLSALFIYLYYRSEKTYLIT